MLTEFHFDPRHSEPNGSRIGFIRVRYRYKTGFGLAVPPDSTVAPSLSSNHIAGKAIDMDIIWIGKLKVKKKDGTEVEVTYMKNPNLNTKLHAVGASYAVKKHTSDKPHWSHNGK